MKIQTEKGLVRVTSDVYSTLTGAVATSCYGVKGMAFRSRTDGLVHLLRRESMSKGVKIHYNDDQSISIDLHIIVDNGVNLVAVGESIQNEVKYNVHRLTGAVATSCYGVKGMAFRSRTDGLVHLLRKDSMSKGVKIHYNDDQSISIDLHIIVDNGVNLVAVGRSIQSEVKYNVHRLTGVEVRSVNVCVDSMVIG